MHAVERGRDTFIDPYATESADEYFAVVSELHFSDRAGLAHAAPAVASLLARFYGPRPDRRIALTRDGCGVAPAPGSLRCIPFPPRPTRRACR